MFGNLDPEKMLVILVFALVLLGPERLPKVARQLGAAWRELTRVRSQVTEEVRSALPDLGLPELPKLPRYKAGALSGFLNDLTRPGPVQAGGGVAADGAPASAASGGYAADGPLGPRSARKSTFGSGAAAGGTGSAGDADVRTVASPARSFFDEVPGLEDPGMN